MADGRLDAEVVGLSTAISACGKASQWQRALVVFEGMRSVGLQPNVPAFNAAISACEGGGQWTVALALLAQMRSVGLEPNVVGYSAAISACSSGQRWQTALAVFDEMCLQALEPNVITYSAVITAFERGQQWELALRVLAVMEDNGVAPNVVSYTAAVSACSAGGGWEQALALLSEMKSRRVALTAFALGAATSVCGHHGEWEASLLLLSQMRGARLGCSVAACSAAVAACGVGEEWARALSVLAEMLATPNDVCFAAAITACANAGQWEQALAALAWMGQAALEPEAFSQTAAISACEKGGQWQRALQLFSQMARRGVVPTLVSYNAALAASASGGQGALAGALLGRMQSERLEPNAISHNAAYAAAVRGGAHWREAVELLHAMLAASVVPTTASHKLAAGVCAQAAGGDGALLALLLGRVLDRADPSVSREVYSALLSECEQQRLLSRETALLQVLGAQGADHGSEGLAGAAAVAASSRLLAEGQVEEAAAELRRAAEHGRFNAAAGELWHRCGLPPASKPLLPGGAPGPALQEWAGAARAGRGPCSKELCILRYVLEAAVPGDAASVCSAVDEFGELAWAAHGVWLPNCGGSKTRALSAAVRGAVPSRHGVLEIGSYIGYSATRMALASGEARITTLEVDPTVVLVARNIVALAGFSHRVHVWTGHSTQLLPTLAGRCAGGEGSFGAVFMDRWGSQYLEDFALLERCRLLHPRALIIADNLLMTGAVLFLWRMWRGAQATQLAAVREYASQLDDWMSITVCGAPAAEAEPPAHLRRAHRSAERLRRRVLGPGAPVAVAERVRAAAEFRRALEAAGIVASCAFPP